MQFVTKTLNRFDDTLLARCYSRWLLCSSSTTAKRFDAVCVYVCLQFFIRDINKTTWHQAKAKA